METKRLFWSSCFKCPKGEEFINVALLVVRYFGGIKLGIGGLVRAYTASAKLVIETSDSFLYENIIRI